MNGKKTYMLALGAVFGAAAAYLSGTMSAPDAIQLAITGALAATIRHGVSTEVSK